MINYSQASEYDRKGRELYYGRINYQQLEGVDFSGLKLENLETNGSTFVNCDFTGSKLGVVSFGFRNRPANFIDCKFDKLSFHRVVGTYARFERCSFKSARIFDWFSFEGDFIDCDFTDATIRHSVMSAHHESTPRTFGGITTPGYTKVNEIRGNDFSKVKHFDLEFRYGIDYSKQKLPTGPDFIYSENVPAALERAREAVKDLDPDLQAEIEELFYISKPAEKRGKSMFFRKLEFHPDPIWQIMWQALNDHVN